MSDKQTSHLDRYALAITLSRSTEIYIVLRARMKGVIK